MKAFDLDRLEADAQLEVAKVISATASNALRDLSDAFWELRKKYGLELNILVQYTHPSKGQQLVDVQYNPDIYPPFSHLAGSVRGVMVLETSEGKYEVPAIGWPHLRKIHSSSKGSVELASTQQKTVSKLDKWIQSFAAATDVWLVDALH